MKQSTVLEATRKYSLWTVIVSSVVLLGLLVAWAWGAFNLTNMGDLMDFLERPYYDMGMGSGLEDFEFFTAWAKVIFTLSAIASTAMSILLALLIAKYAKRKK